jgi:NAD(P)-dependent dehydrogenase (short-subunit alcohol dehydrogenase family)
MKMAFAGKVIIITGGASGIGLATVKKLLEASAVVHSIDRAKSTPIPDSDSHFFYPGVDISSREAVAVTFNTILQRSPQIHGLVNCAGISPASTGCIDRDDNATVNFSVNIVGAWNVGSELLRRVEEDKTTDYVDLSIVMIGSSASLTGVCGYSSYSGAKHAVVGFVRSWARDFGPRGVRVNCIAPGAIQTPLFQSSTGEDVDDDARKELHKLFDTIPLRLLGRPEELASSIIFLLSDAASYITGQTLAVNGGVIVL